MDAKAEKMKERFEKRQEARLAELQRKKETPAVNNSKRGNKDEFTKSFSEHTNQTKDLLGKLDNGLERPEITAKLEEVMQSWKQAQKILNDSVLFLPDFEVKNAQSALTKLQSDINTRRDELLPRKKFGFKTRTKAVAKTENSIEPSTKEDSETSENSGTKDEREDKTYTDANDFGFSNSSNSELSMSSDESNQKDIKLSSLENCMIKIYGCPSALHVTGLKNCKVFCGPISRASFLSDCVGSHFSLACQQARIHTSKDCIFNVHVTGKAIIEDCSNLGFAPYNWSYENLSSDFQEAGLKMDINKWHDVDDFNWLTSSEPSPNWHKIPEASRLTVKEPSV